jgi:Sigma-70, region 4/Histidine kinase-, DNA gyrase B-, and HSP90-like ATPase
MDAGLVERNQEILELHRAGFTLQEIGDHYGITRERVRQIVQRAEGGATRRRRVNGRDTATASAGEKVRLRIGNLAKAVLVTGQAYQDPKDALNEFVSNAADDYAEAGIRGGRIQVVLQRKRKRPVIAVDDVGRGMGPDRLREVARNLFESTKAGDKRTLGEKAIGLLAFQQLGGRCDVVSRALGSDESWVLRLERGRADASLDRERRRARQVPGTTVYLADLDPETLRVLTQRKVVDYLRRRRGSALASGDYSIEVVEGRTAELVTPEEPEGVRLAIPARPTLWGRIEFALYVTPHTDRRRRVMVVGRAGTTIIDDLAELDEFDHEPWTTGQVSGQVLFEALQQTAGRRALLRDRDAFPVFRDAVESIEPVVCRALDRVRQEVDERTAERLSEAVRRIFGKVLKELADLDNPMRTPLGSGPGEGGLLQDLRDVDQLAKRKDEGEGDADASPADPTLGELTPPAVDPSDRAKSPEPPPDAHPEGNRSKHLPTVAPDPDPVHARSRFDADVGVVFYNDRHSDYLIVKDDEAGLIDYLATLVAKEYVVYNNPRASSDDLAEEMVRMLVRVRRHLPRRR